MLIGTAGHVDHGKTALIQALTGIDTDRLKEEKKRGITIDLGYAYLPGKASIIDVPGHEKFIKNMLAGAGGIDLVLMVIAADDGIMPQTQEHLDILQLLKAKDGIIVISKCDLPSVDEEWRNMLSEEIKERVKGTFLENAPLVFVSAHTGEGINELKSQIYAKIDQNEANSKITLPFRIPVDRVFSVEGFGTVVTGTLIEGTLNQDNPVAIYPAKTTTKARKLQVHDQDTQTAVAGQRVAVNLSGISRNEIKRGDILAPPEAFQNTRLLDVKLKIIKNSPRSLKNGSRVHFYHGTSNTLCKIILLGTDQLSPGSSGYAQLIFQEEVTVKRSDNFVIRFYSPVETIGGGVVLDESPKKHRRTKAAEIIESLRTLEQGGIGSQIMQAMEGLAHLPEIQKRFTSHQNIEKEIEALTASGQIIRIGSQNAITSTSHGQLGASITKILTDYHKENPLLEGIRKEELRSRAAVGIKPALFDQLLQSYKNLLSISDKGRIALPDFKSKYTPEQKKIRAQFEAGLQEAESKAAKQVLEAMLTEGSLIMTSPGIFFTAGEVENAKATFQKIAPASLAQFRDALGTSRKFALSLLEYFDRIGLSRKEGDIRVIIQ